MSQQINLINLDLIKQQAFLTFNRAVLITVGLILTSAFYATYAQKSLAQLTAQRQQLASDLSQAQIKLTELAAAHKPREANPLLLNEIDLLAQKLTLQQQVLATIDKSTNQSENSYAAIMRGFARQTIEGLWLTGFHFDSLSNRLSIRGATLKSDLVPEYIVKLSAEPAFKGKLFSGLNIQQPQSDSQISPQTNADISTNADVSNQRAANANSPPAYIEFSLISINADSSQTATHQVSPVSGTAKQRTATGDNS
ncbi:MAG: MSHA biogenesis protein MshI [Betaproteobacteria bacterium HGW-Betaproteobacteria-22]|nr:MAG: MSHA biogenesis protein MshI [Betaproteobacteria bacterium HGW-Betaproteobacteria-22]